MQEKLVSTPFGLHTRSPSKLIIITKWYTFNCWHDMTITIIIIVVIKGRLEELTLKALLRVLRHLKCIIVYNLIYYALRMFQIKLQ